MRSMISVRKFPGVEESIDWDYVFYRFTTTIEPKAPNWYESAKRLAKSEPKEFQETLTKDFTIATPKEGIVASDGAVLSWFTPAQKADFPPFMDGRWLGALLNKIVDQRVAQDKRTILYGTYDSENRVFYFDPDEMVAEHILLAFLDTVPSPEYYKVSKMIGGRNFVNVYPLTLGDSRIDEFIIGETKYVQNLLEPRFSNSVIDRVHNNIHQHEQHVEAINQRNMVESLPPGDDQIELIRGLLENVRVIGNELVDINPKLTFTVLTYENCFMINGRRYAYTAKTAEHLKRLIKIAGEKPFSKMVPLQLQQVFGQMNTCLSHLDSVDNVINRTVDAS